MLSFVHLNYSASQCLHGVCVGTPLYSSELLSSDELLPAPVTCVGFPDDQCHRDGSVFKACLENDVSSLPLEIGGVGVTKHDFQTLGVCFNLLGETCRCGSLTYKSSRVSSATGNKKDSTLLCLVNENTVG